MWKVQRLNGSGLQKLVFLLLKIQSTPKSKFKTVLKYGESQGTLVQYHDVRLKLKLRALSAVTNVADSGKVPTVNVDDSFLLVDYIFLDAQERKKFAQATHEYLIEQLQFTGRESLDNKHKLNFNHPVKELVWVSMLAANDSYASNSATNNNRWFNFTTTNGSGDNPTADAKLQLNGHDRFSVRQGSYFNYVQAFQHHTGNPSLGINVYSFGLTPEEHQPSGTCNFSRIDNATLQVTRANTEASKTYIYAVNYNVLRIMSGMGGLAYSN